MIPDTRDTWLLIDYPCRWCGQQLKARQDPHQGLTFEGFPRLQYRHSGDELHCTLKYEASPYDGWAAGRAYKAALQVVCPDCGDPFCPRTRGAPNCEGRP